MLKETMAGEIVANDPFFAPTPYGMIDGLFGQYRSMRTRIERLSALMDAENGMALGYFQRGNAGDDHRFPDASRLFQMPAAIQALDADFWQRTLNLTDVYNAMPQKRRDEWNDSIRNLKTPEFTEENVTATMEALMSARGQFMAERVDGIFRGLSGEHVTNSPMAFGKRMILSSVFNEYGNSETRKSGLINDLRAIVAKFMGRDEPHWNSSKRVLETCMTNHGEWHSLDGGSLRLRCYLKGTAHLEVHPEMAWRLNAILHTLYPRAIPANYRVKPPKPSKTFATLGRPLPFAVLQILDDCRIRNSAVDLGYGHGSENKLALKEALRILEGIGGVVVESGRIVSFDYDPTSVMREIRLSGCVPDRVAHQYYPTPDTVARAAVEMADIVPDGDCRVLEPSAGQGALAALLPIESTLCIEVSPLHCTILRAKGFMTEQADFIAWAEQAARDGQCFDRIVMNPPYSDSRWCLHLQAAVSLLAPGGRVVCILPASQRDKDLIPGLAFQWSPVFANQFEGTSIDVAIFAATKSPTSINVGGA